MMGNFDKCHDKTAGQLLQNMVLVLLQGLTFHLNPLVLPDEYTTANFITNAFGQFDNYTPMQMAQYVATVANNGKEFLLIL